MLYPLGILSNLKPFGFNQLDIVVLLLIKFCLEDLVLNDSPKTIVTMLNNLPEITLALIECRH